ncbi:HD domain-containing protein [Tissierella sp.]|uniref:CCA tRNA nucleotidyltransferase n=1 Tax=Tissierella sp. TaxID=41274 RepID=UPI002854903C|nr:HD domain-containing protein [Tissierella sp.]MDR7857723.1 HD domain-containing protein [Tissierella sp.]
MVFNIPKYVKKIIEKIEDKGYSAYIVGGSVRDILIGKDPSDYDVNTDALPEDIEEIFKEYRTLEVGRKFGTVVVVQDEGIVEVTTFRSDGEYIDGRRPEEVYFSKNLFDDLSRRDFTINAMAYNEKTGVIDYFNGINDLKKKTITTVGEPWDRFKEDYLRIMRAIRFATQLEFSIDNKTKDACRLYGEYISNISIERIREEFFKILLTKKPSYGIRLLGDINVLAIILPELIEAIGFNQHNPNHDKDVYEHTLSVLDNTSAILHLRLAALLHDIGKPKTFTRDDNGVGHFYGHDKLGANMAKDVLQRWKSSNELIEKVTILIDKHMSQHDDIGEKGLKRLISKVGKEDIFILLELQKSDRLSSNMNANIEDLLEREKKIKEIIQNKEVYEKNQLAINGNDVVELGYKQGKIIGEILDYLLEEVLENPDLNERDKLIELVKEKFKIKD